MSLDENNVHVFLLPLGPKFQQAEIEMYGVNIPPEEQITKYLQWQDQQRALLGRALLQWILKKYFNDEKMNIARTDTGRPYVINTNGTWQGDFNLSHSGEWIIAAITSEGRVGVDVEKIGTLNEDILPIVLSENELSSLKLLSKEEQTKRFYELWTVKESIYKMGIFLNLTLDTIDTFEYKKKELETYTFYIDQHHPVSISWKGTSPKFIQKTWLTRDELIV